MIINKYNKYIQQNETDQQTIKPFDKLYRKSLQDNVIDKTEYESLCNIFTKHVDENKNESFYEHEFKKLNFFSNNKLSIQPRTEKVTVTLHVTCYNSCNCYVASELLQFM